jgi:hypothetical protein
MELESVDASVASCPARARGNESTAQQSTADLTETERMIDEIVDEMLAGRWRTGPSHRAMCEKYNLSLPTIEGRAAEASRTIKRLFRWLDDPQATRDWALQSFARISGKAEELGDAQGLAVAIKGAQTLAEYAISKPAAKLEVQVKSPEQLQATLEQWLDNMPPEDVAILNRKGWFRTIDTTAEDKT